MRNIDRRRFMQGGMGMGFGLTFPSAGLAQTSSSPQAVAGLDTSTVRMVGDGVSLSPAESAALWTHLAREDRIVRDSYSNGGTVEELEASSRGSSARSGRCSCRPAPWPIIWPCAA